MNNDKKMLELEIEILQLRKRIAELEATRLLLMLNTWTLQL